VTFRLKARIVEVEKTSIARLQKHKQQTVAREWLCKHISKQPSHVTEEQLARSSRELLGALFSVGSMQRLYNEIYLEIMILCRMQAKVILNHENPNVHGTGQGEAMHRKYKRLKLSSSQVYDSSPD
jgi:hypothetical protein